ncbi:MAG: elongation factor P [Firmicutes bacterium]|nr:elongation factor P [Bacillota bacterium]
MISTNDFKTGMTIELDGEVYTVVYFQHVKPGKGAAFVRSKLKNIRTEATIDKTFRAGEKVSRAHVERREMQYLYRSGEFLVFMDTESFEQINFPQEELGDTISLLKENMLIYVMEYKGDVIGIELPNFVELAITETEPGIRGDTVSGATKRAVLETGAEVLVPLFIEEGDVIRVDTRSREYMERV